MLAFFRASNYHRTVDTLLTVCVSPGDKRTLARRFSDYPELFWLSAAARDRPLRVFDFGGGLGQTLLQYSQVLGAENIERWTVYELPEIVAKAHADRVTQRHAALDFTTDLTSAATSTVFLAAGALHYWETSIREIVNQLGSLPEHFLTNRSPLQKAGDGFITVQAPGNGKCLVSCGRRRF